MTLESTFYPWCQQKINKALIHPISTLSEDNCLPLLIWKQHGHCKSTLERVLQTTPSKYAHSLRTYNSPFRWKKPCSVFSHLCLLKRTASNIDVDLHVVQNRRETCIWIRIKHKALYNLAFQYPHGSVDKSVRVLKMLHIFYTFPQHVFATAGLEKLHAHLQILKPLLLPKSLRSSSNIFLTSEENAFHIDFQHLSKTLRG